MFTLILYSIKIITKYSGERDGGESKPKAFLGTISGNIKLNKVGLSGVTINLPGIGTVITDQNGNYIFSRVANGNYTLTPSMASYVFTPESCVVTVHNANIANQNFTAIRVPHGHIMRSKKAKMRSKKAKTQFMSQKSYTHGYPRYIIDHKLPLKGYGAVSASIMQLPTKDEAKANVANWKQFFKRDDRTWSFNTKNMIKTKNGIVMAWIMMDATKVKYYDIAHDDRLIEKEITLTEVDCPQRKTREFMGETFYKDNKMMIHKPDELWSNLQHDEQDEILYDTFCK